MRRRTAVTLVALGLAIIASTLAAQTGDPPSRAARISALTGSASLQPAGATDWSDAALNYTVTTGDRIYTPAGGRVELEIGPMSVRVSENADVTVTNLTDGFLQLGVEQGTVRLSVYRLARGDSIEIDTPNGAVMVTTPGEYRVDIPEDDRFTTVSVDRGTAEIVGPGVDQIVRTGQAVQLSGTDNIRAISVPRPPRNAFDSWDADREHRVSTADCSRYMNPDIPGCADLSDNGQWDSNPQYGAVWYPTHVAADWVPYRDGRWAWIDPWGWSWVADESWGYAPFHYGRWTQVGARWGWIPGPVETRPYYAPALVAFVGGAGWSVGVSIGTQAWFPLGPREAYIPSYHHDDAYLRQVNMSNVRNVTNITTIINVQSSNRATYVNRNAGITAVSTDAFRSGRPVAKEVVKIAPENRGRGSVISHPSAAPEARAALGGRPAAAPPPAAPRPAMITTGSPRKAQPNQGGGRGQPQQTPPPQSVPQRGAPQQAAPQRGRPAPVPEVKTQTPPPSAATPPIAPQPKPAAPAPDQPRRGRPIITRNPPPPAAPTFEAKAPALNDHPGKPLEPQQTQNVRNGRPAGPPKDRETVDHRVVTPAVPPRIQPVAPAPVPNRAPTPAPQAAPPQVAPQKQAPPQAAPQKQAPPQAAPPKPVPSAQPVQPAPQGRGRGARPDTGGKGKPDSTRGRPIKPPTA